MSYAAVAASGPQQSDEEHESQASSLVDVDSPHVNSVKSDYEDQAVKTETQAERIAQEAEHKAQVNAKRAEDKAEDLKKKASAKGKEAKSEVKKEAKKFDQNKDNPVFIGNYILWGITAAAVGYGAYQRHSEGKLDVETVGTVALGLGALGAADYFASKWLVENKYPTK
ncbi:hypothetical protein PMZ80_003439 [Knufia obscura]|uniref:Mitochondrial outer membrane protein OM14 C-terminal domain-containing protein n=1 Tax=Knufia obscura TaxID=1635080 RepID=A0ABR0RU88_9EURO|nr:hypothetical protein PMZ80_003439 [Knufia obscura]